MKRIKLISFLYLLLISGAVLAQSDEPLTAKTITEKGTKGDIILGKEYMQKQLSAAPQVLQADSTLKKEAAPTTKKKKCRQKKCSKTQ
jgi:hypothetical protein